MVDLKKFVFLVLVVVMLSSCSKDTKKEVAQMNFEELKNHSVASLDKNDKTKAIEALEMVLEKYPEKKDISNYRLTLADLYFKKKQYAKADICYYKYAELNPGQSEYAMYKSILSKFYQILDRQRDQTITRMTIEFAKSFLLVPEYSVGKYAKDIKDIIYTCEHRLIDREVYVYNFYIQQGKYKSAQNRIKFLRERFLLTHVDLEPKILYMETKLAMHQKNKNLANEKNRILLEKFPESEYALMANKAVTKKRDFIFF